MKEEKFIEAEKTKYDSEDTSQHEIDGEKLKIAQVIDRESRQDKPWHEVDMDEEPGVFDSDGDDSDRQQKSKPEEKGARKAKLPTKKKFAEIMKADDAFPTLENDFAGDDDEDEDLSEAEETTPQ